LSPAIICALMIRGLRCFRGTVIIIPDADLGGARIADRVLTALPDRTRPAARTLLPPGPRRANRKDRRRQPLEVTCHGRAAASW
jgi:hypothetical protein